MRRTYAALLFTLFVLGACSDGQDSPESSSLPSPLHQNLMVHFPPPRAHLPDVGSIPVHGRIDLPTESLIIEVDAGGSSVMATIEADGSWHADDVPVGGGDIVPISIATTRGAEVRAPRVVSKLWRVDPDAPPIGVAASAAEGWYLHFSDGDIRSYDGNGDEIQRSGPFDDLSAPDPGNASENPPPSPVTPGITNTLENWQATEELVAQFTIKSGGCRISAIDPANNTVRELLVLDWPTLSSLNNCRQASIKIIGENLVVIDKARGDLHVINPAGELSSLASTGAAIPFGSALAVPGRSDQISFIRANPVDIFFSELTIFLVTNDLYSGASVNTVDVQDYRANAGGPLHAANVSEGIYIWDNGNQLLLDDQTESLQEIETSGYTATELAAAAETTPESVLLLDDWGRVNTLDTQNRHSNAPRDFAPFSQPPITFSDAGSRADRVLFKTEHFQSIPGTRGGRLRTWENLHALNIDSLSYRQLYATSTYKRSLSFTERNFFGITRFPTRVQNENYSIQFGEPGQTPKRLQLVNHRDGQRTLFDLGNYRFTDESEFVIGLDGRHLVINWPTGIFEYDISTQTLTRSLQFNDSSPDYGKLRVAARFPGENGAVYLVNSPFSKVYRADFEAGRLVTVSGPQTGSGPALLFLLNPWIDSWSAQDNAVYFSTPNRPTIMRVDLDSGERTVVFSAVDSNQYPLPTELVDIHFLPDRNAVLASGNNGVYYLDLATNTAAAIGLQVED